MYNVHKNVGTHYTWQNMVIMVGPLDSLRISKTGLEKYQVIRVLELSAPPNDLWEA